MSNTEPKWLKWAKQIQAISQTGLTYTKDVYDAERYEELRNLSLEIMEEYTGLEQRAIRDLFANETGYATPKVDIRCVVFSEGKVLMVREKADGAWSLPGGWADIGLTPGEIAVNETREESGYEIVPERVLAILDTGKHNPPSPYHVYKIFILCKLTGGKAQEGVETDGIGFFDRDSIPEVSAERNTREQVEMMFRLAEDPAAQTLFD